LPFDGIAMHIKNTLEEIQVNLFERAKKFREENMHEVSSYEEFKDVIENKGGFVLAHWDGTAETEDAIKKEINATVRCIPFDEAPSDGVCVYSGKPSSQRVIFAKAY